MKKSEWSFTGVIGVLAVLAGWGLWDKLGWETPDDHNLDINGVTSSNETIIQKLDEIDTHWECYEDGAELGRLLAIEVPTNQEAEDIRQLQDAIDENDCHKY